jgi:hypothetical protein
VVHARQASCYRSLPKKQRCTQPKVIPKCSFHEPALRAVRLNVADDTNFVAPPPQQLDHTFDQNRLVVRHEDVAGL